MHAIDLDADGINSQYPGQRLQYLKKSNKNKQATTTITKTNQKAKQMKYVFNRLNFRDHLSLYVFTMHLTISWKMKVCFATCAIKENRIQLDETIK